MAKTTTDICPPIQEKAGFAVILVETHGAEQQRQRGHIEACREPQPGYIRPRVRQQRERTEQRCDERSLPKDQHLCFGHARKRGVLQAGGQPEIVHLGGRMVVEDLADGVKLDEISAQRPPQEGPAF
jgi:hypothetical protein